MKEWRLRERFSSELKEQLLLSRGLKTKEEQEKFLNPDYNTDLYDPFLLKDMNKAVARILAAIERNERILVYGDYDSDGICATVVFSDFFKKIGFKNFELYIPDRKGGGHGLDLGVIDYFQGKKTDLVITVDCGIKDGREIEKARRLGMDTIVIDHHLVGDGKTLPPAAAIVDPKQEKCPYPFKFLSGAGLAFKVVQALLREGKFNVISGWSKWLLDVVAISTVSDMVSLTGENRVLLYYGLRVLRKTQRPGLDALLAGLNISKNKVNEDDIAFLVGPRINTTSRMDHATISLELLTSENLEEVKWLVSRINQVYLEQKEIIDKILAEMNFFLEKEGALPDILFLGRERWPASLLGVVINKALERYNRPIFLWGGAGDDKIKGSARSPASLGVNLVELLDQVPKGLVAEYGGHPLSAGFLLEKEKIPLFEKALRKVFASLETKKTEDILLIDWELGLEEVDWKLLLLVEKFGPFGVGNPKPLFLFKGLEIFSVACFGNDGVHLRLDFKKMSGEKISAIAFFWVKDGVCDFKKGDKVDLVAGLEKNYFAGREEIRLRIVDLRKSKSISF
jgi:single-stranded-DNA-specific exonuclease